MSTNTKLADKALQALVCMRGLQMHLGREVCEVEASELAAALADHKAEQAQPMFPKCASGTSEQAAQAQADDWQHLKPYGYAPGNYMSRCRTCGDTPVMDKRAITCRPCAEAKFAASQAQAERVGLTDEQIRSIESPPDPDTVDRAIWTDVRMELEAAGRDDLSQFVEIATKSNGRA